VSCSRRRASTWFRTDTEQKDFVGIGEHLRHGTHEVAIEAELLGRKSGVRHLIGAVRNALIGGVDDA
jgi:hypothetical protein